MLPSNYVDGTSFTVLVNPNPTSESISLNISGILSEKLYLRVLSISGVEQGYHVIDIYSETTVVNIPVPNLPKGIYLLQFLTKEGSVVSIKKVSMN